MLVLSRKIGESIKISGGITVTVVRIGTDKVRLGITAPDEIDVDREEVAERRKGLGAYYTPKEVIDPDCGTGAFITEPTPGEMPKAAKPG